MLLLFASACVLPDLPLGELPCDETHPCAAGFTCIGGRCMADGTLDGGIDMLGPDVAADSNQGDSAADSGTDTVSATDATDATDAADAGTLDCDGTLLCVPFIGIMLRRVFAATEGVAGEFWLDELVVSIASFPCP